MQYRFNGTVDFYRDWDDYQNGFGSFETEFWLGNFFIVFTFLTLMLICNTLLVNFNSKLKLLVIINV